MRMILAVVMALVLVAAPAGAQVIAGSGSGAALLVKDGQTEAVGQVLAEVGYRFPFSAAAFGELVGVYGANVNSGQLGGLLYRHYLDPLQGNGVMPGATVGFFAVGAEDIPGLVQTTIFLGGGALLDIQPGTDTDTITGYAEAYKSMTGDDAVLIRFGIRAALN